MKLKKQLSELNKINEDLRVVNTKLENDNEKYIKDDIASKKLSQRPSNELNRIESQEHIIYDNVNNNSNSRIIYEQSKKPCNTSEENKTTPAKEDYKGNLLSEQDKEFDEVAHNIIESATELSKSHPEYEKKPNEDTCNSNVLIMNLGKKTESDYEAKYGVNLCDDPVETVKKILQVILP